MQSYFLNRVTGKYGKIAIIAGFLLLLAALLGDIIGLSSGEGIGFGQVFMALSGILIILAGVFRRNFLTGINQLQQ